MFITFSGIDGSGKSTQIGILQSELTQLGLSSVVYSFWDDIVALRRTREALSANFFKGDTGVGSPEHPINRKDKNVRSWYANLARLLFYLLDVINLNLFVRRLRKKADVVIFDRYIYDELANLTLRSWWTRGYAFVLIHISPRPMISYIVDAQPEVARARKPEYPLDFLRRNREAYIDLSRSETHFTVVGPGTVEAISCEIIHSMSKVLPTVAAYSKSTSRVPDPQAANPAME